MPTALFPREKRASGYSVLINPDNRPVPQLRSPRIWGTFNAAGGAGATTLALHLAQIATRKGMRVLLVESDLRAPLREILGAVSPFWEEYRLDSALTDQTLPRVSSAGITLLTKSSAKEVSAELFHHVINGFQEYFDLIVLDNPALPFPTMKVALVVENSLPSLIGLHTLLPLLKPKIVIINKFSARIKREAAIKGFITDANIFNIPKSTELGLAMGMGITRRFTKVTEKLFNEILQEMLD